MYILYFSLIYYYFFLQQFSPSLEPGNQLADFTYEASLFLLFGRWSLLSANKTCYYNILRAPSRIRGVHTLSSLDKFMSNKHVH